MIKTNVEQIMKTTVDKLWALRYKTANKLEVSIADGDSNPNNIPSESSFKKWEEPYLLYKTHEYYWFKASFEIKEEDDNTDFYLCVETFLNGSGASRKPQGLLYLNNHLECGIDVFHTDVLLKPGKYEMLLHFYTHDFPISLPVHFTIKALDKKIVNLFYDLKMPTEGLYLLLQNDREYYDAATAIERTCNLIDFRYPYTDEFYKSIDEADKYLQDNYYNKLCNSTKTVELIGHTHIDVAWMWDLEQTRLKSQRSFSTVLKLMKDYPEYRFMTSQPQLFAFLKEDNPTLFNEIKEKVKEGRWEMDGTMWLEADCNLTSDESLVRQVYYGKKFIKEEFNKDCNCLWLPDVFGYSAAVPQILNKAGINKFVTAKIGWNDTNRFPYDAFIWQGIDGSKVFATLISACYTNPRGGVYDTTYTSYCEDVKPQSILGSWNRFQQKEYTDNILMSYGYGDGGGGPTFETLEKIKRLNKGLPGIPKARINTLKDTLDIIENNFNKNSLELKRTPKWNGELYFEFHRGTLTSVPEVKYNNRKAEFALLNTELLNTLSNKLLNTEYPNQDIDNLWHTALLNQFHDILPGSSIKKVYDDSRKQYEELFDKTNNYINSSIDLIANDVAANSGTFVFNPNGFTTTGTIKQNNKTYIVENIPAFGYKVVDLNNNESNVKVNNKTLENSYYIVKFNDLGNIVSLFDKRNNREIVKQGREFNEIRCYEDMPFEYDNWELAPNHFSKEYKLLDKASFEVLNEQDRQGFKIIKKYHNSTFTYNVYLYNDGIDRVDVQMNIEWNEQHQLAKVLFPFDILADKATYEIQFGNVERSTTQNTSWDSARFESCAHKWVDVSETNFGFALLNDAKYGFSCIDDCLSMTLCKCGSFPNDDASKIIPSFTYSIVTHNATYREADIVKKAYVLNRPLISKEINKKNEGTLVNEYSFIQTNKDNVIVETVKMNNENDVIVRMYEAYKERTSFDLTVNVPFKKAYLCDLMENELEELPVNGNKINLNIKPFEILTIKLK